MALHDFMAKQCPGDTQRGRGLLFCCSPWLSPLSSRSSYSDACSVSFAVGDRVPGEQRRRGREHRLVLDMSRQHSDLARVFYPLWCCGWGERVGFWSMPSLGPFLPVLSALLPLHRYSHSRSPGRWGATWDIIRVVVHFSGCFPIRGGTVRIMDGADVWRKGMFGLHGQLMPSTGQCWGVKSVIPGMGDGETSSGSSPVGCTSPTLVLSAGAKWLLPKERLQGVLLGAAHSHELAPHPELLCDCRSQMGAEGLGRKHCSPRTQGQLQQPGVLFPAFVPGCSRCSNWFSPPVSACLRTRQCLPSQDSSLLSLLVPPPNLAYGSKAQLKLLPGGLLVLQQPCALVGSFSP